jgi:Glycosyltransferase like family
LGRVKRFAFLTCVRDDALYDRLRASIDELARPRGVEVGLFQEREERNLAAAYNRLQAAAADWKYKAYVHDDVVILNRRLIDDVLRIFRRRRIGLLGAAGCRHLPASCVWWDGSGVLGRVVHVVDGRREPFDLEQPAGKYERVEAVDGLCLITQHDLAWDEDLSGFHFYDVAQSTRYRLAGCDVVVPRQDEPWLAHDHVPGPPSPEYLAARDEFKRRYAGLLASLR